MCYQIDIYKLKQNKSYDDIYRFYQNTSSPLLTRTNSFITKLIYYRKKYPLSYLYMYPRILTKEERIRCITSFFKSTRK